MKPAAATTKKPVFDDALANVAIGFASAPVAQPKAVSGLVPHNDVRLTANIRSDLHLALKIEAATKRTTIGELLEQLIEAHFAGANK